MEDDTEVIQVLEGSSYSVNDNSMAADSSDEGRITKSEEDVVSQQELRVVSDVLRVASQLSVSQTRVLSTTDELTSSASSLQVSDIHKEEPSESLLRTVSELVTDAAIPIHLTVRKDSWRGYIEVIANIDWNPYEYSGKFNVYDNQNRLMRTETMFNINHLSSSRTFKVSDYPNGIYTIVMEGKTGQSNGNQIFKGKISFEVRNGQFYQTIVTPTYKEGC